MEDKINITNEKDYPRIKTGNFIVASKDGDDERQSDPLVTNSYFATFLENKPEYWDNLNIMLYREGRLRKHAAAVEDIVDKFSFLFLARDQVAYHESKLNWYKRFYVQISEFSFLLAPRKPDFTRSGAILQINLTRIIVTSKNNSN